MKLQNVPLDQIVDNPWRDRAINPIDKEHVAELRTSIGEHGFFGGLKGRRRNGMVELGCGHARVEAARKAGFDTIPIYIDDIDDDAMLRLMTDENATQAGGNAGAVINEVGAVTRRLIEGLMEGVTDNCPPPPSIKNAFGDRHALITARGKLEHRRANPDASVPIGSDVIRAYLGQGKPENAARGERQIREAVAALKQSSQYDKIIDETLRKFPPPPDPKAKPAKTTEIIKAKESKPRRRMLDERTAGVFKNDHQFHAFREAVTTSAAQKAIPVSDQLGLAKQIMREEQTSSTKKQVSALKIKVQVQGRVEDYMKEQRKIDREEREAYLAEQIDVAIDDEVHNATRSLRSLISSLLKLEKLADKYPAHPKLGGFSARLDDLVDAIKQFSRKLK